MIAGDVEGIEKFQKRLVKVTRQHNDECKQLLKLMGIPYIEVYIGILLSSFKYVQGHFVSNQQMLPARLSQIFMKFSHNAVMH